MRYCLAIVFVCFLASDSRGQLLVDRNLKPTNEGVADLIHSNNLDFAIIAWATSNWFSIKKEYIGLVQKEGESYFVQITVSKLLKDKYDPVSIKQVKVPEREAGSLLKQSADSAFVQTQKLYDALAEGCPYEENGTVYGGQIFDGGYIHLAMYKNGHFQAMKAYAPKFYLEYCTRIDPEFSSLKHLVITYDKLAEAARNIQ